MWGSCPSLLPPQPWVSAGQWEGFILLVKRGQSPKRRGCSLEVIVEITAQMTSWSVGNRSPKPDQHRSSAHTCCFLSVFSLWDWECFPGKSFYPVQSSLPAPLDQKQGREPGWYQSLAVLSLGPDQALLLSRSPGTSPASAVPSVAKAWSPPPWQTKMGRSTAKVSPAFPAGLSWALRGGGERDPGARRLGKGWPSSCFQGRTEPATELENFLLSQGLCLPNKSGKPRPVQAGCAPWGGPAPVPASPVSPFHPLQVVTPRTSVPRALALGRAPGH